MEHACYGCGGPVEGQAPFCPSCGAPQIRVSLRPSETAEAESGVTSALPAEERLGDNQIHGAGQIQWRRFLGIALSLAPLAGFSIVAIFPLGCVLLAGAVFWSIHRYRRRHLGPLTGLQGAKLGAVIGLLSAGFSAVFFIAQIALNPSVFRQLIQDIAARNPTPEAQQFAHSLLGSSNGIVLFAVAMLMFLSIVMLIVSAMIGALAASVGRNKP